MNMPVATMDATELRQKRAEKLTAAGKILEKARAEGRALTAEETQSYDVLRDEAKALKATIDRLEEQEKLDEEMR
ncbi:MAG: hypothetical protein Q8R92_16365, partial [Deltaproteobacteria bacterium]|nr:hypothetical protein [Deltaproteobacteria bacterium]